MVIAEAVVVMAEIRGGDGCGSDGSGSCCDGCGSGDG